MQEIKCPKCGEVFQVDESGYAQIAQQVRDHEFNLELERRIKEVEEHKSNEFKIEEAEKEREIERLNAQLENASTERELAVTKAIQEKEKELADKAAEITKLKGEIDLQNKENQLNENNLIEKHKGELALRDEEIERLKDFKARQSTKMVGESLEQHCLTQFNQLRMTAFPNAYFEKDNSVSATGSKGDFIFRDSVDGVEYISIMFEMKNEMDTTATKHKNEDFFKELDKDRNEKNCEYAVLVSLLESDNELYNGGIVDVSYKYPKMYVIRPQFFIPIITLLRNAAQNSLEYQRELQIVRNQQIDLFNFEDNLNNFKDTFSDSIRKASDRFDEAIKGIDDTIDSLNAIKEKLKLTAKHFNTANNKLEDVSIKKLTKGAPSVRAMLEEINSEKQ